MAIPNHARRRDQLADKEYPGVKKPHERDPGGNALPPDDAHFSEEAYPDDGYTIAGGGLTAPSTSDMATADRNVGHDNVNDWKTEAAVADISILWDEEYGYAGLGGNERAISHTPEQTRRELRGFAASSYKDAQLTRNVATAVTFNTFTLVASVAGPSDPLPLVADDWGRRRVTIRSLAANTLNAVIGTENNVAITPGGAGLPVVGAGGFVLEPGKDLIMECTAALVAMLPGGVAGTVTLSVMNELYER